MAAAGVSLSGCISGFAALPIATKVTIVTGASGAAVGWANFDLNVLKDFSAGKPSPTPSPLTGPHPGGV